MPRSEIQPAPEPMPETASTLPTTPDRQAVESVVAADGDDDDEGMREQMPNFTQPKLTNTTKGLTVTRIGNDQQL
eukprot:m.343367 g.343367  ORF g.343367 m.343367 type:complete len:75 (+) comp19851_c1_seq2:377-601(+)